MSDYSTLLFFHLKQAALIHLDGSCSPADKFVGWANETPWVPIQAI